MPQGTIICEHCGSTKIVRDPDIPYAKAQERDSDTNEPVDGPKTYFIFICLSCGKRIYLEKFETRAN